MRRCATILIFLFLASTAGLWGATFTSDATFEGTATYNGYYAWGSGTSWAWFPGGSEAHYYSDCYPCYFVDQSRIYMEFALPSITGNVTGASLMINVTGFADNQDNGAGSAALYHQANSSALTGNAYNDRGSLGAGESVQNIISPGLGWVSLPVTSFILSDYANGYSYATFAFFPTGNGWSNSLLAFSAPGGEDAPYLSITTDAGAATPEPATFALIGLGGAVLLLARRRRSR